MSPRAVIAMDPDVRPSARIAAVAALLDEHPSQIRRLVAAGRLEAHRVGKRGIRVYLDSVAVFQCDHPVGRTAAAPPAVSPAGPKPVKPATKAAHRQAMSHLRGLGLV